MAPAQVLGVAVPRRRPPLRRDLHELRRQAAGLRAGHPGAARRRRQPAAGRVRQRGQRPRHRRVRPPIRLHGVGRLRLDRGRGDHHPRGRLPAGIDRQGLPRRGHLRPRDACTECAVARVRRARRAGQRRRGDRRAGQHHRAPGCSAATTTTRTPPTSGCATACTGPATWPTATPTAGSTSPAAPRTGCGSTARTWPPPRSSGSCCGCTAINQVAVYAVPDEHVGDQVMAAHRAAATAPTLTPDGVRGVPRRPAATCRRRPGRATSGSPTRLPEHRDQQDPQARAGRAWASTPPAGVLWTRDAHRLRGSRPAARSAAE